MDSEEQDTLSTAYTLSNPQVNAQLVHKSVQKTTLFSNNPPPIHTSGDILWLVLNMESMAEFNVGSVRALLSPANILYLIGLWVTHSILTALYNASPFHPLSQFPGPKLAAATYLYEAYFEWWLVGRYGHEIRQMHERYGESSSAHFRPAESN